MDAIPYGMGSEQVRPFQHIWSLQFSVDERAQAPGSPSTGTRASTPLPGAPDGLNSESTAADNVLLRQLAIAISDIEAMRSQMMVLWEQELSVMLPEDSDSADSSRQVAEGMLDLADREWVLTGWACRGTSSRPFGPYLSYSNSEPLHHCHSQQTVR
jgi:hypothetical protein